MEASQGIPSPLAAPPHPLMLAAAASVTVLSLAGVGVLAGWLPGPATQHVESARPAAAPISIQQAVTLPPEKTRPASERPPAGVRRGAAAPLLAPSASGVAPPPWSAASSPETAYRMATPLHATCSECGVVEDVREVALEAKGSGGGAVAGGVVGGIIGNQIGKGATRDIATVLGALGGAFAGNHLEKAARENRRYDVIVRFDDGSRRSFSSETPPAWHSGDRVKLQNGLITRGGGNSDTVPGTI